MKKSRSRWYPAKRALPAMLTHGRLGPFGRIPSKYNIEIKKKTYSHWSCFEWRISKRSSYSWIHADDDSRFLLKESHFDHMAWLHSGHYWWPLRRRILAGDDKLRYSITATFVKNMSVYCIPHAINTHEIVDVLFVIFIVPSLAD